MEFVEKYFEDLTTKELYEILKIRNAVFIVEQNCPYQDIDGTDCESLHIFSRNADGSVAAYLRIYPVKYEKNTLQMGRVLTAQRGKGFGGEILRYGLKAAENMQGAEKVRIEAQTYAVGFYEKEGFRVCSDEFLEDGIPHVKMEKRL